MAKERIHRESVGRPKEKRTNTIKPITIQNIEELTNDYIDLESLVVNLQNNKVLTPLEFMIAVYMSDDCDLKMRVDAAKAASKYVHKAKPVAIEHTGKDGKDLQIIQLQELGRQKLLDFIKDREQEVIDGEIIEDE